jgi:hypothetical protein
MMAQKTRRKARLRIAPKLGECDRGCGRPWTFSGVAMGRRYKLCERCRRPK